MGGTDVPTSATLALDEPTASWLGLGTSKPKVFAHGVLYVSMSRCGDPDNLFVYGQLDAQGRLWTDNVVYQAILPKYD